MPLSETALRRLGERALDVELVSRLGFGSETKRWPVEQGAGAPTRFEQVEALVIPFTRNGEVVRRKFKPWQRLDGAPAYLQDKGGLRIAFNEDCLRDESLRTQPLIITEGELDAVAAIQCGFARTISVPDGAPPPPKPGASAKEQSLAEEPNYAWLREIMAYLTKELAPEIILATDGDGPGAALMHDLSVLLGRFRCKFLTYPKAQDPKRLGRERCKDLNEVLVEWGLKGVVETISRASFIRVDGIYLMSELPPLPPSVVMDIGYELLGENYKMRLGDFVVITGIPGLGKSTFVNDLVCRVVLRHGVKAGWASFEQTPQRDHRRALRSWYGVRDPFGAEGERQGKPAYRMSPAELADADAWIDAQHVFIVPSEDDDITLDWMLDRMEAAVVQHGVKVIVVDPWNEMDHARARDETMTEYVGRAIKTLKRFARKFQVHVIVVAHPTKSFKDGDGKYKMPTLYDISDSANWYNKCDLGLIVHRENAEDTLIKVQKSKYHEIIGRPGEVKMQYSKDERRFVETERVA